MDYQCKNCKNRTTWECEDYNCGCWDVKRCDDHFELDIDTLDDKEKETILNIAAMIRSKNCYYGM